MDFEKKHQEDLQRLRGFRLLDDDFMTKVFEDISCAELLLRIILNDEGIRVLEAHSQRGIKNLQGRSVKLDILAVDSHNRVFNVEGLFLAIALKIKKLFVKFSYRYI